MLALHIKFGLVLVVDLYLCIKLGLKYEILNLGIIEFILICHILGLLINMEFKLICCWGNFLDELIIYMDFTHFNYLI